MLGYTSTSKLFNTALKFAFDDLKEDKFPVVFEIVFKGYSGLFELINGYTAYPEEQEVLVQDGLTYQVIDNTEQVNVQTNQKYHLIKLQYPA